MNAANSSTPPRLDNGPGAPRRWASLALGVTCGAVFGLLVLASYPPLSWWPLALLAPLPLLAGVPGDRRGVARRLPLRWWTIGCVLGQFGPWLWLHRFLFDVAAVGVAPLAVYLSLWYACGAALVATLTRRWPALPLWVAAPIVLAGADFLRADVVFGGYSFFTLAQPTIDLWGAFNPAHAGGLALVTVLTALPGAAAVDVWRCEADHRPWRLAWCGLAIAGLLAAGWFSRWGGDSGATVRVGIVQTNMPQSNKMGAPFEQRLQDYRRWLDLTERLAARADRQDVILWPETMFMGDSLNASAVAAFRDGGITYRIDPSIEIPGQPRGRLDAAWCADELIRVQQRTGVPMLVGALATEQLRFEPTAAGGVRPRFDRRFNSVFLVRAGAVDAERYDKMELTPFGEMIPILWRWPSAQQWLVSFGAAGMAFDLSFGQSPHVFNLVTGSGQPVRVVTPICFEAAFSRQCRRLVFGSGERRADLMVNASNDGWFGPYPGGRAVHLLAARWRCVELATPMVRAVNTGISGWIDARGRVRATGPEGHATAEWVEGVLTADVPLPEAGAGTLFSRVGDLAGWAAAAATLAGLVAAIAGATWERLRRSSKPEDPSEAA